MSSGTTGFDDAAIAHSAAVVRLRDLVQQVFAEYRLSAPPVEALFPGKDETTTNLRRQYENAEAVLATFERALQAAASGQGDKLQAAIRELQRVQDETGPLADFFGDGSSRRG